MSSETTIRALVEPTLVDLGLEVVDLEHHHGTVKLTIDHPDGLGTELLTQATRMVSRLLDESEPVPGAYTLEVTSPGVERKLRMPDHFQRAVGEQVSIKTLPDIHGDRRIQGDLVAADESGFVVRLGDGAERRLAYTDLQTAKTVFDWSPTPKPGKGGVTPKEAATS